MSDKGGESMELGNVLLIGESGVGKSTLINAVLKKPETETGYGTTGTTKRLEIYRGEDVPFRVIDTIGFEPTFFQKTKAINAIKKWSKESAKKSEKKEAEEEDNRQIHVIWFCIEGTRRKLFRDSIRNMLRATHMWKSIPIIVVITKSYSNAERRENVKMVRDAFEKWGKTDRLKDVIPVVAAPFVIDEDNIIPPNGIDELINTTNDLMPEAIQLSKQDVEAYILTRKRAFAQGVIATSVVAGVTATAIPVPIADGALLSAIELAEIKAVATIYGIKRDEKSKIFISTMVEVGTVSAVARSTISMLKTIPGINIAASIMNAIIGGSFVTLIGEAATYAFEQIYLGNKTLEDTDWVKKLMETKLADDLTVKVETAIRSLPAKPTVKEISRAIGEAFKK